MMHSENREDLKVVEEFRRAFEQHPPSTTKEAYNFAVEILRDMYINALSKYSFLLRSPDSDEEKRKCVYCYNNNDVRLAVLKRDL